MTVWTRRSILICAALTCTALSGQDKNPPTLEETTDYIKTKLNDSKALDSRLQQISQNCRIQQFIRVSYDDFSVRSCKLSFQETISTTSTAWPIVGDGGVDCKKNYGSVLQPSNKEQRALLTFDLKTVRPDVVTAVLNPGPDTMGLPDGGIASLPRSWWVTIKFTEPQLVTVNDKQERWAAQVFHVADEDLAPRLAKAFAHGATLCGSKADLFSK